jgi:hypothetical protein
MKTWYVKYRTQPEDIINLLQIRGIDCMKMNSIPLFSNPESEDRGEIKEYLFSHGCQ